MHLRMYDVYFDYRDTPVLKGVGIDVAPSEVVGILGPNGSGKTTMLRCMNRILTPRQGSVLLDDREIQHIPRMEMARSIGFVPQNSSSEAASPTVFEVVLMGRRPHITWEFSDRDREIVWAAMEEMDVKNLATREFFRLSSGQTQRVLMARAIAQEASVLLLDEPTSNLDIRYQLEVMEIIRRLSRDRGMSACAVIHDLDLAMRFCDKAILLDGGTVVAAGDIREVLTSENIRSVFGVEAVIEESYGRTRVVIV